MDHGELRSVVELATMAPSIHNTQPWRFATRDDGVDVYADFSRQLQVIDPDARQLHISCGAAIEQARLAVRSLGHGCAVTLLPAPEDPELLAHLTVEDDQPPTPLERALVREIPRRHTHREAFDPRPLPPDLVEDLRRGVAEVGAWLRPIERSDEVVRTAVMLSHADAAERADTDYQVELRQWLRPGGEPAPDGIPSTALPQTPLGERHSTMVLRDFDLERVMRGEATADEVAPPAERPFLGVLGTPGDDTASWLQAGRGLAWLLLRAAAAGVSASPLNQVLDLAGTRSRFARELGLVGHPQMLLRMGYGGGHPSTRRRPVDEVLG